MLQHKPRHLGPGALSIGKMGRAKHHFKINPDGAEMMQGRWATHRAFQMQLSLGGMAPKRKKKIFPIVGLGCEGHCTDARFENRFEIAPIWEIDFKGHIFTKNQYSL